jgi:hypothetical protein
MKNAGLFLVTLIALVGCGGKAPVKPTIDTPHSEAAEELVAGEGKDVGGIIMYELPSVTIGPYTVEPMYEEKLEDGHFNLRISGAEVAAVREWVGPEDASGVMVVKTEMERDYHHGHVEMPNPIPADARLWIEIESPIGELFKGSTPLN